MNKRKDTIKIVRRLNDYGWLVYDNDHMWHVIYESTGEAMRAVARHIWREKVERGRNFVFIGIVDPLPYSRAGLPIIPIHTKPMFHFDRFTEITKRAVAMACREPFGDMQAGFFFYHGEPIAIIENRDVDGYLIDRKAFFSSPADRRSTTDIEKSKRVAAHLSEQWILNRGGALMEDEYCFTVVRNGQS